LTVGVRDGVGALADDERGQDADEAPLDADAEEDEDEEEEEPPAADSHRR
jgi:hypothetical protein